MRTTSSTSSSQPVHSQRDASLSPCQQVSRVHCLVHSLWQNAGTAKGMAARYAVLMPA